MDEKKVCLREKLGVSQIKVNATIPLSTGKVAKILTLVATSCIRNIEESNAEAKIIGEVIFEGAVFLEDGSLSSVSARENFVMSYENAKISPDNKVEAICNIFDGVNASIVNGDIVASPIVSCEVYLTSCQEFECNKPDDNIFVKEVEFEANYIKDRGKHNFVVTGAIGQGDVVFKSFNSIIKSCEPKAEYFVLSGETVLNTLNNVDGNIKNTIITVPFEEEIAVASLQPTDIVRACICNNGEGEIVASDNGTSIDMPMEVCYKVIARQDCECIEDAYSTEYEVNFTTQSIAQTKYLPCKYYDETIMSTVAVEDQTTPIDKIVGAIGDNINIISTNISGKEISIEGIALVDVIYKSEEDDKEVNNSIIVDVPFVLNLGYEDLQDGDSIIPRIIFGEITAKVRKGQLEIVALLKTHLCVSRNKVSAIITEINLGEPKTETFCPLEIYVVRPDQTIWDIGKQLNISAEELLAQNEDISLPLVGGEKLIVYRKR